MSRWQKRKPRDDSPDLFDAAESARRKEIGKAKAEANAEPSLLEEAREISRDLACPEGITLDDVVRVLVQRGHDVHALGNAAGSVFKGKDWRWTGEMRASERTHRHAGLLRVWVRA